MPNRLSMATSPYLLQHSDNPVDWQQWGDEAFAEAKRRDVPVLLSVGYAACHWCHVMAHESFEDTATAEQMNEGYVNVKVDREERPDVDAVYMSATQALTGQGGWPMTVFLTPEGRPFYAGTYFPPQPRHQLPSFRQLLTAISETWVQRRDEVETAGGQISAALADQVRPAEGQSPPSAEVLDAAVQRLAAVEDTADGGFGGAPKFPPSMILEFLLRRAAIGDETASGIAGRTLEAMAASGTYDQVGGGFARYSVDKAWAVPHFEKMLYDNALLTRVYLHWWRLTGNPTGARIALETCDWLLAALRTQQGGFASSLDADTEGAEGLTYVWTPAQLTEVLGEEAGAWVADRLQVTPAGSFEEGTSTLRFRGAPEDQDLQRWTTIRPLLAQARSQRPQPGRDDKVVAAWNGLAVAALAETGVLLDRADLLEAATGAAELILAVHLDGSVLRRVSRDGTAGAPGGVLEDYGDVAEGFLALHSATGEARWLEAAGSLLDVVLAEFFDAEGVHDTPASATDPALAAVLRPADPTDNAYPSGASAAAGALLSYAALTGSSRHRSAAERALGAAGLTAGRAPQAFGWALAVSAALLDGPREIAIVGPAADRLELHRVALRSSAPGAVVSAGEPDAPGVPLLADRPLIGGRATAYVCRDFVCELPVTSADDLATTVLARRSSPTKGQPIDSAGSACPNGRC